MDKFEFMEVVSVIFEELPIDFVARRGEELKKIIDSMVTKEIQYEEAGVR